MSFASNEELESFRNEGEEVEYSITVDGVVYCGSNYSSYRTGNFLRRATRVANVHREEIPLGPDNFYCSLQNVWLDTSARAEPKNPVGHLHRDTQERSHVLAQARNHYRIVFQHVGRTLSRLTDHRQLFGALLDATYGSFRHEGIFWY